jgi:hypothetical protein
LLFVVVYTLSASHTVILNNLDAAEFQTVGAVGGVLHQPYPLWCLIARVVSSLPVFEPAFRVTLVSIVFGALCVALLSLFLLGRTRSVAASAGAAAAFGLSFTFWQFSAVAEIYALVTFLFIASLFLIDRLTREDSGTTALLLALVLGLLLSQQTLNAAALPGMFVLLLVSPRVRRRLLARNRVGLHAVVFLLPFTLYLYTFLADRGPYPMNWLDHYGQYVAQSQGLDEAQMQSFFGRVRFQMSIARLEPEFPGAVEYAMSAYYWLRYFFSVEFPFAAPLFAAVGLVSSWRRDAGFTTFLLVLAAPYLMLALTSWGEKYAYSFPVYVVAMVFVAEGIAAAARGFAGRFHPRWIVPALAVALVVTMPLLRHAKASPAARWFRSAEAVAAIDTSTQLFYHLEARNDHGRVYGERVAAMVEPGSLVVGGWNKANILFYHKFVNGALEGVTVTYVLPEWRQIDAIIEETQPKRIYLTFPPERYGLDRFVVDETRDILLGERLYTVHVREADSPR